MGIKSYLNIRRILKERRRIRKSGSTPMTEALKDMKKRGFVIEEEAKGDVKIVQDFIQMLETQYPLLGITNKVMNNLRANELYDKLKTIES